MKSIVFDTSSIISIVTNNMIDVIRDLKKGFDGEFYITPNVKEELVDKPLKSKIYNLEAMLVTKLIDDGFLKVLKPKNNVKEIEKIANTIYSAFGRYIQILQCGEIEALALALEIDADAFIIDERTTRVLIEEPENLTELLERKLHSKIKINKDNFKQISKITHGLNILRSSELMFIAHEKGLLAKYISQMYNKQDQINAIMWGLRTKGCAISVDEIERVKKCLK